MRDRKFRAWDENAKKYHYFDGIFNDRPFIERSSFPQYESSPEYQPLIIEDFTGLTDKNGNEIYEGDILSSNHYPYMDSGKQNYVAIVEWIFAGWQTVLHCVNKQKRGISEGINEYIEDGAEYTIIGNIHENPELLEEK